VLASTDGSARVKIGGTEVLAAVKAEITAVEEGAAFPENPHFFVDISPVATQHHSRKQNEYTEELARVLYAAYNTDSVLPDRKKLVLAKTHVWVLYVDISVLQLDGNLMDTISLAAKAALADTKICNVIVRPADEGKIMIDLPEESSTWSIDVSQAPLLVGVNKVGDHCVVDADPTEEQCSTSALFVGVQPSPSSLVCCSETMRTTDEADAGDECVVTCIVKNGVGTLELESIDEMVAMAVRVARTLNKALTDKINQETTEKNRHNLLDL